MKKIKLFSAVFITTLFLVTLFSPIETYAQAARPATRAVVERSYVDNLGHDICVVRIEGYGSFQTATIDGLNVPRIRKDNLLRGREVVAFREYYDCGILPPGQHQFIYKISPINSPNRPDLYAFFTIQK